MIRQQIEVKNILGLHARTSTRLTQTASQYSSDIWLTRNDRRVNAKSIMGVMMLAAAKGVMLELEVNGADEKEAADAILTLFEYGFKDDE